MTASHAPHSSAHDDEAQDVMDERTTRLQERLDAVAAGAAGRRERQQVGGGQDWARLQQRLEADARRHRRAWVGVISAVAACAVVGAGVGWSQLGGSGPSVRVVPAASAPGNPAEAEAIASAQAQVAGQCPAVTDVAPLGPEAVDEGQRLSEGLTQEQAVQQAQDTQQASILDAWLRCTYPAAYGQLRVEYDPQFHAVAALTDAAGPDPLAGAPVGVLAGRVQLETTAFSEAQMQVLWTRVDAALNTCGLLTSSSIELGVIRIGAGTAGVDTGPVTTKQGAPGVEAVEECLDAADLGTNPGRAQVEVTNGWDRPT